MRFCVLTGGLLVLCLFALTSCRPAVSSAPLAREIYVWQRAHTGAVADSVRARASAFDHVVILAAEISWPAGRPRIVRVPLDVAALKTASSLGFALRINAYSGSFAADAPSTRALLQLTATLLADARASGLNVTELQLDFDAPERRLAGYRHWLETLRPAVAPARLTFTALPSWLKHRGDFAALAATADDYVLQVHSLTRPASPEDPVMLCDPVAARRAVDSAATFNRPFRVALPTYGYQLAFDPGGRFLSLSAEGAAPDRPAGTVTRELAADPAALSELVSLFSLQHPAAMKGIIWYRLPVAGDRLNWPWPTLDAVMRGQAPAARVVLEARVHPTNPGLVDYLITNTGNAPFTGAFSATVTWTGATRLASDALPPFALETETAASQRLTAPALRLAPGARQSAGWLRLSQTPLSLHVSPSP
ncbi:MAG TPA: DUF3142 domain-containing protein [Rariglobus sp.]